MSIFERIKELADKRKISLQKVATDLGFGENYIYNLKGAKSPAADKLALIADYFDVSVDYLLGRSNFYNDNERNSKYFFSNSKPTYFDELLYQSNKSLKNLSLFLNSENIEKNEILVNWVTGVTTIYSELILIKNGVEQFDKYFEHAMRLALLKFEEKNDTIENFDEILGTINRTAVDFMNSVDSNIYSHKLLGDFIQNKEKKYNNKD
ncbi:helix-turn-helix domain-containing protein [uncultured Lactococcus sp.]|jgi:transcriptional regulator with XRE-family HTH domain|uniref:helix-turn-helix domain-containing protein n=1 Tax=uncultured Lactococcus sp. TaxID=167973 RepID=UPI0035A86DAF